MKAKRTSKLSESDCDLDVEKPKTRKVTLHEKEWDEKYKNLDNSNNELSDSDMSDLAEYLKRGDNIYTRR